MNRRQLLIRGSASLLIVSMSGCVGEPPATEAWRAERQVEADPRLVYLADAVLAPSPHNRQPWLVSLDPADPSRLTLWPDLSRLLPQTDPQNRQIMIGLGAFLEALSLSAAADGRATEIEVLPEGSDPDGLDGRPVAHIWIRDAGSGVPDPLYAQLRFRRTNRTPFEPRPVPQDDLLKLGTVVASASTVWRSTSDMALCETLRSFCRDAWRIETSTPRTHLESVALTRIGRREIEADPDGISLSGPMMAAYSRLGILTRENMKDPASRAATGTVSFYNGLIDSARSFAWLTTQDNSRASQIAAGRDWLRIHLAATEAGLALQPLSQVLQEFPEMAGPFRDVHKTLSVAAPARIQGLFRIGYADAPHPSPRWPLETRLIAMPGA